MSIEFDVYAAAAPNGTKLTTLTDLEVKEFRVSLVDTGEGRLVINRASPQATAANFAQDNVVKVRVTEVSANPIFAFLLQEGNFVAVSTGEEADETLEFGGPGLLQYLDRAIMPDFSSIGADPGQTGNEGYWPLYLQSLDGGNTAAGSMFLRCINEALGRTPNPYPDLTVDFSHTTDSSGAGWTTYDGTFRVPIGDSVLTVLRKFQTLGLEVQVTPNLLVRAFEYYGTDRSATVTLAKGVNILTGVERAIHATPEKSNIMVGGENYTYVYVSTAAPIVREGFFGYGTTDSVAALTKAGQVELARRSDDTDKIDVGLLPMLADGGYIPGPAGTSGAFWVGDSVKLHTGTAPLDYNMATRRVSGIRFSEREAGDFDVVVELNGTGTEGSSSTGAGVGVGTGTGGATLPPVSPGEQVHCSCPPGDNGVPGCGGCELPPPYTCVPGSGCGSCTDTFTRTIASTTAGTGWGTSEVTDFVTCDPILWSTSSTSGLAQFSIDGTKGIIANRIGYAHLVGISSGGLPLDVTFHQTFQSKVSNFYGVPGGERYDIVDTEGLLYVLPPNPGESSWSAGIWIDGFGTVNAVVSPTGWGSGTTTQWTLTSIPVGIVGSIATISAHTRMRVTATACYAKVWLDGDPEPSSWDATEPNGFPSAGAEFTYRGWATASTQSTLDNFTVIEPCDATGGVCGPAESGQDAFGYILDGDGPGFLLPGPFMPGSLKVYVDGIVQIPDSVDPAAGTFDLGWTLASGETASADWRGA